MVRLRLGCGTDKARVTLELTDETSDVVTPLLPSSVFLPSPDFSPFCFFKSLLCLAIFVSVVCSYGAGLSCA